MAHASFSALFITAHDKISLEGRPHSPPPHNLRMCFLCLTFPSPQILSQLLVQNLFQPSSGCHLPSSAHPETIPFAAHPQNDRVHPMSFVPELSLESTGIDGGFCRHSMGLQRESDTASWLHFHFSADLVEERVYSLWVEGCDELSSSLYSSVAGLGGSESSNCKYSCSPLWSSCSGGHLGLWIWSLTPLPTPNLEAVPKTAFTRPTLTQRQSIPQAT